MRHAHPICYNIPVKDRDYLKLAIEMAQQSEEPLKCAAILVDGSGNIIASAYNSQRADGKTAAHAEMKAIAMANEKFGRTLPLVTAYVTCEPCPMCMTAIIYAAVERVVFAYRNDELEPPERRINLDCYDFISRFPNKPTLVHITMN